VKNLAAALLCLHSLPLAHIPSQLPVWWGQRHALLGGEAPFLGCSPDCCPYWQSVIQPGFEVKIRGLVWNAFFQPCAETCVCKRVSQARLLPQHATQPQDDDGSHLTRRRRRPTQCLGRRHHRHRRHRRQCLLHRTQYLPVRAREYLFRL
jgi:hypothetical protein